MQIELNETEKLTLQYKLFEYQGTQIAVNQFVTSDQEYSDDHYNRMMQTYLDKYRELQMYLYVIFNNHGYKNVSAQKIDFKVNENILTVWV
jgi:inorganic pyrophosphatase/exopolyphosphatase